MGAGASSTRQRSMFAVRLSYMDLWCAKQSLVLEVSHVASETETRISSSAGSTPARQGRAASRKRVLRERKVTTDTKRRQRACRPRDRAPKSCQSRKPTSPKARKAIPREQNVGTKSRRPARVGSTGVVERGMYGKGCRGTWELLSPGRKANREAEREASDAEEQEVGVPQYELKSRRTIPREPAEQRAAPEQRTEREKDERDTELSEHLNET